MTRPATFRPATDSERALAAALRGCSFPVASTPKRFARELAAQLQERGEITEPQAGYLRRLVAVYRRQIRPEALLEADRSLLTDGAARAVQEDRRATRWTATPGRPVPFWVVLLTGRSTVEAIVAKYGEGATFERREEKRRPEVRFRSGPPPELPPQAQPLPQLSLAGTEGP